MKKIEIIKSSREYTEIINTNIYRRSKYFSIYYRKTGDENKYGITIPKKTGTAVIRNKIKKAFEAAYSSEDVDKNIKRIFMERLARTSSKVNLEKIGEYKYEPTGELSFHDNTRYNVVVTDWNALADAVSHNVDVPDCSKERPNGERLDSGITITIADAA